VRWSAPTDTGQSSFCASAADGRARVAAEQREPVPPGTTLARSADPYIVNKNKTFREPFAAV
jgi:hypothetical protein